MSDKLEEIVSGRKTFFITPDRSLFPENYLEEYLSLGFETYFIENDKHCSIGKKVEILVNVFKDAILFFNIDAIIPGIDWAKFIMKLQRLYGERVLIGVLYLKRRTVAERLAIEKYYLYDVGLQSGCVQLEYRKNDNFGIIEKILFANQARGRRKHVRALCNANCTLVFNHTGKHFSGIINDLSLSHFSCVIKDVCPVMQYEKLQNILLNIKGLHIRCDAVLFMQRNTEDGMLYIFAFMDRKERSGLDALVRQLLIPKLYEIMLDNCRVILNRLFYNDDIDNMDKKSLPERERDREIEINDTVGL